MKKVNAIPPPTTILSHFSISDSSTAIFDDTFAPPTTAANGPRVARRDGAVEASSPS